MKAKILTAAQASAFQRNGYVVARKFFNKRETDKLYAAALADKAMREHALDLKDQTGKKRGSRSGSAPERISSG